MRIAETARLGLSVRFRSDDCQTPASEAVDPHTLLRRHQGGDWGDLDRHDWEMNDRAVREGGRVLSSYRFAPDVKFWVITEGDRSCTTAMLPDEY